ncbi:unnamed protein product [Parascedosporium putredinis]|uniref:DUF7735 domain-containing protein n=1 Tax=Parascedosporium putredinis TaxID=1442378 RepID=A0A9P1H2I9_9PEZI|nr:unnamed protein product [Parascedosporium putredinis]CAI7993626.1 unnamed protein product [Parascedosporium putredinis]
MQFKTILGGAAMLSLSTSAAAKFGPGLPAATNALHERQAPTTVQKAAKTGEDPWQCATEDISQYLDNVPTPTGNVEEAINNYGQSVGVEPCMATAKGEDILRCSISDPARWCGFTTAASPDVLSSYSTYLSEAVSYWTANSESISAVATDCPVAWGSADLAAQEWIKIAKAHAECYLSGDSVTKTGSGTGPTGTGQTTDSAPTSTSTDSGAISPRHQTLGALALMGAGLALLANAV